jgi:hypothetical protein
MPPRRPAIACRRRPNRMLMTDGLFFRAFNG